MLFLTEKINIELPNEDTLHSFLKDIPDNSVVVGNPGKIIKEKKDEL